MNLFWTIGITGLVVVAGISLCFWLLTRARDVPGSFWILEHIHCPIIRIAILLIIVSQVYPVVNVDSSSLDFWRILGQQGQFNHLINILFWGGLALGFIPLVSHPVFALPLQSMLTIALVFSWQYENQLDSIELLPSLLTLLKVTIYMVIAYFVTRETSIPLSRWIDKTMVASGSIRLASDAIYLVLQIPVMLIYCNFLKIQLT